MDLPCSICKRQSKVQRLADDEDDSDGADPIEMDPEQASAAADRLEEKANLLAEAGQLRGALSLFTKAAKLTPQAAKLHEARAQCLLELDELSEACDAAKLATALRPDWFIAHATFGRALLNAGRLEDAVNSLRRAAELGKCAGDADFEADIAAELSEAQKLLERHWMEHHDLLVPMSVQQSSDGALRIRQCLDCSYCNMSGEHGPGGAVWAAGVVLTSVIFSADLQDMLPDLRSKNPSRPWEALRVLELGSGTGVGGLAAAAMGAHVLLTDRDSLVPTLQMNMDLNRAAVNAAGGQVACAAYDWAAEPPDCVKRGSPWNLIVAADLVYSFASVPLVVQTLANVLCPGGAAAGAPVVYAHNPRSDDLDVEWRKALAARGMQSREIAHPSNLVPVGNIPLMQLRRIVISVISLSGHGGEGHSHGDGKECKDGHGDGDKGHGHDGHGEKVGHSHGDGHKDNDGHKDGGCCDGHSHGDGHKEAGHGHAGHGGGYSH